MTAPVRVAVDALGGDRAPEEIVAGALAARTRGRTDPLRAPRACWSHSQRASSSSTRPDVVEMDEKPGDAVRTKRAELALRGLPRGGRGSRPTWPSRPATPAPSWRPGSSRSDGCPASIVRRSVSPADAPRGSAILIDGGANADARPEHLLQFAPHGNRVRAGRPGDRAARPSRSCRSARSPRRETGSCGRRTSSSRTPSLHFAGNVESRDRSSRSGRRRRLRRLHGQRRPEDARGRDRDRLREPSRGDDLELARASSAAC